VQYIMEPPKSPFVCAIERYLQQPTRKKRASFIQSYIDGGAVISAEEIQVELMGLSDDMKQRASRRLLWPVFEAVCDYDAVISALVQADPMPSALVWGGLKVMLDVSIATHGANKRQRLRLGIEVLQKI
jgi:hypothetical protein